MNRQQFVLNELTAIARDMISLVEKETVVGTDLAEAIKERVAGLSRPPLSLTPDPHHLKPEVTYIMSRLESVRHYLGWNSTVT